MTREEIEEWNFFSPSLVIGDDRDSVSGLKLLYCTYIKCQTEDKTVVGKLGGISVRFELKPHSPPLRVTFFFNRSNRIEYGGCTSSSFTRLPLFYWGEHHNCLFFPLNEQIPDMGESYFRELQNLLATLSCVASQ